MAYFKAFFGDFLDFVELHSTSERSKHQNIIRNELRNIKLTLGHVIMTIQDVIQKICGGRQFWGGVKKNVPCSKISRKSLILETQYFSADFTTENPSSL